MIGAISAWGRTRLWRPDLNSAKEDNDAMMTTSTLDRRGYALESHSRLDQLEVLVVGVEELISRDVIRALVAERAIVTAAACDERSLAHLQRDLGLYRTAVNIAAIDLYSSAEMRLYADNLRGQQRLPHLVVCCSNRSPSPATLAQSCLLPSLALDVLPQPATRLGRAVASLNIPTLPALLDRPRHRGLFDPDTGPQRVLIGSHVFALRRREAVSEPTPSRRPSAKAYRASAAAPSPSASPRQKR